MIYDAPGRLEKRTKEPRPETLLLEGDVLTVQRGGQPDVLDLKAYPRSCRSSKACAPRSRAI